MSTNSNSPVSLADIRHRLQDTLSPKYGAREAAAMARIIMQHLKGWDFNTILANEQREASDFVINRSDEILRLLLNDCPLQYILGETSFYGLNLKVAPGVLIPRPETEELVDLIVKENNAPDLRVLDLCTGSGAIALALARNLPFSKVEAIDISPDALAIARYNASALKTKIEFFQENIFSFEAPENFFDIIVSNPPYVDESEKKDMEPNVVLHEPHSALFVPDDNPLLFYRRIAEISRSALKDGGRLYLEINPRHAAELKTLLESFGFRAIDILRDIHGRERFATARKS